MFSYKQLHVYAKRSAKIVSMYHTDTIPVT